MRERPILFRAEMVRAILAGRKTQTRRVVFNSHCPIQLVGGTGTDDDPAAWGWEDPDGDWALLDQSLPTHGHEYRIRCPYGEPGDLLWVRETWAGDDLCGYVYRADHPDADLRRGDLDDGEQSIRCWRSPIHMPRRACRLTLPVSAVRVERVQAITEEDARAEGVDAESVAPDEPWSVVITTNGAVSYRKAFARLWDAINGKRAPWASTPWVWVIEWPPVRAGGDDAQRAALRKETDHAG